MCIYSRVMIITQSTTVLITRSPVQWRGQHVMHHVYIMYIYFPIFLTKNIFTINYWAT